MQTFKSSGVKVSRKVVIEAMKKKYGLGYRRIKRVSLGGNSERSKVLRSLYA